MGGKRERDDPAESLHYSCSHVRELGVRASPLRRFNLAFGNVTVLPRKAFGRHELGNGELQQEATRTHTRTVARMLHFNPLTPTLWEFGRP